MRQNVSREHWDRFAFCVCAHFVFDGFFFVVVFCFCGFVGHSRFMLVAVCCVRFFWCFLHLLCLRIVLVAVLLLLRFFVSFFLWVFVMYFCCLFSSCFLSCSGCDLCWLSCCFAWFCFSVGFCISIWVHFFSVSSFLGLFVLSSCFSYFFDVLCCFVLFVPCDGDFLCVSFCLSCVFCFVRFQCVCWLCSCECFCFN